MNPDYLRLVGNHLWQSTLFAGVAGLLTLALRNNRARVRHWVWVAASCKFLIPFSVLISLGTHIHWRTTPQTAQSQLSVVVDQVSRPFTVPAVSLLPMSPALPAASFIPGLLWTVWACGVFGISCSWWIRWRRIRAVVRAGRPVHLEIPVRVVSSPTLLEPGVFGVFRPLLLVPEGILDRLTAAQLKGVIAHELCHVYHRDNLISSIHMFVETVFWFHPLVWWIGKRMVEEREQACDEKVLTVATDPEAYAAGILSVCKFYLQVPPFVAGAAGANLRKRLERILSRRLAVSLNLPRKLLLLAVGLSAIAGPIAIGLLNAPMGRAQSRPDARLTFEVASVKLAPPGATERSLSHSPGARLITSNATLKQLVFLAYQVMPFQVTGGPDWVESAGFDIEAKAANPKASQEQFRQMIQTLLADRFQLKFHFASKEVPVYALVVARNGSKLVEAKDDSADVSMRNGRGEMTGVNTMAMFASALSRPLQRKVVDETGLTGAYTFKLQFVPDEKPARPSDDGAAPSLDGASLFTALREQLGLTLKPAKGPVEVLVIDHADKPSVN